MEEAKLVRRAVLGDAPALEELIMRYYDAIHAFCCRRMGGAAAGVDACQDTFLKMVQNLPRYREKGYFKSWLYTIAANCCNDAFRKKRPEASLDAAVPDAGSVTHESENGMLIREALNKLPGEQKEVVILRYYHDFSTKDVARIQRVPAATVKTRLHRGLKKLRKILGEDILLET